MAYFVGCFVLNFVALFVVYLVSIFVILPCKEPCNTLCNITLVDCAYCCERMFMVYLKIYLTECEIKLIDY